MKIVIPGGSGHVGTMLSRALVADGHDVVVLSRGTKSDGGVRFVAWDAVNQGEWSREVDGADVVINLAGRTVDCRYTEENLREMMDSRVNSTRAVGVAIAAAVKPPRVWLQMSTATIYAHRFDAANDEQTGIIGGGEASAPAYWKRSVDIAQAWERTQEEANTQHTRKVLLRTAMVMSVIPHSVFDVLAKMTRRGLGGSIAGGKQYVSWIHEEDFVSAIKFLIDSDLTGPVNLSSPGPVTQKELMGVMRKAFSVKVGLPATAWMAEVGAFVLRTDTELLLKSRRVVPKRLLDAGFRFRFPVWNAAAVDLARRRAH